MHHPIGTDYILVPTLKTERGYRFKSDAHNLTGIFHISKYLQEAHRPFWDARHKYLHKYRPRLPEGEGWDDDLHGYRSNCRGI